MVSTLLYRLTQRQPQVRTKTVLLEELDYHSQTVRYTELAPADAKNRVWQGRSDVPGRSQYLTQEFGLAAALLVEHSSNRALSTATTQQIGRDPNDDGDQC